jgi:[ribosomal protein S18]-alanine N-acetyltransferase
VSSVRSNPWLEGTPASVSLAPMRSSDLPEVLRVEYGVYPYPWTRGNFLDSLDSGYENWVARDSSHTLIGYFLMMPVVDEAHLLNITVSADWQGRGMGRLLLDKVVALARASKLQSVLLEVRPSNHRAVAIYDRYGFMPIGRRRNYYPAPNDTREDAIVMRLPI